MTRLTGVWKNPHKIESCDINKNKHFQPADRRTENRLYFHTAKIP
jgi:hypothetical protein